MKCNTSVLILIVLSLTVRAENEETESEYIQKRDLGTGFFFALPKTIYCGRNETVCLTLQTSPKPTKVMIDLKIKEKHYITTRDIDTEHTCFDMYVPSLGYKEPHYARIQAQIMLNGTVQRAQNQDPILIYPNKQVTFIQTNQKIYKPGDKVKIRVLVLDHELTASNKHKIPEIKIKNPLDITVSVWDNVVTELGLVHLEYQLSQETVEGKWLIEANSESSTFEVRKHVLPRFKVTIHHPKVIYTGTNSTTFQVCAKYTYGQNVKGFALIKISDSVQNMKPISRLNEMHDGCATFVFTSQDLYLHQLRDDSYSELSSFMTYDQPEKMKKLYIVATVTESGTNQVEFTTAKSSFSFDLYDIKFLPGNLYFQPGLPYTGTVKLTNVQAHLENEVIEICYTIAVKRSWNVQHIQPCSNYTVGADNTIPFTVLPFKNNVIQFSLYARSVNHINISLAFMQIYRLHSTNGNYIYLKVNNDSESNCGSSQLFTVYYTVNKLNENNLTFYYMIKSRGRIHKLRKITRSPQKERHSVVELDHLENIVGGKHKFTKLETSVDKFLLKFKLDERIISNYQIMVYYILSNGEVVAASKDIAIKSCLKNTVQAKWSQKAYNPGDVATLHIQTGVNSLCSVSAVDKSTKFLTSSEQFNLETLLKPFLTENDSRKTSRLTCIQHTRKNALALSESSTTDYELRKRRKRFTHSHAEDMDTFNILQQFGVTVITNLRIITKPCYDGPVVLEEPNNYVPFRNNAQFYVKQYFVQNDDKPLPLRYFFPETWLWDLIPVSKEGEAFISRNIPHTITNWVSSTICVSPRDGVGISETTEVTTFQPFFVDVLAPYSVKRGELLHLHIKIFNYLNHSLPVRVTLMGVKGLENLGNSQQQSVTKCISPEESADHVYFIKCRELGKLNITVAAELDSSYPDECGPEFIVYKRDVVSKVILVEAEGYPMEVVRSTLLCTNDTINSQNITWNLQVPHHLAVTNTEKAKLLFNADLLGSTIENLEELLTIPTGCGEQIMATLAPNLYILRYLNSTNKLSPIVRQRAIRNIKIGYQRILAYAHRDGSFSAFGKHDPFGSMFLTTFVVRTLVQAKPYIYVDDNLVNKAVKWIFDHQLENGCFAAMYHVFQDMGGTSKENSTAALTAYVIISLLESNIDVPESISTNAKFCIRGHHAPDKYTLAISSYALFMVGWESEAEKYLDKLVKGFLLSKSSGTDVASPADIEIMSYTLLSLLYQNDKDNLAHAHYIVRWLSTKKSPRGGFQTTQDTVVALDALCKYALMTNRKTDLNIQVSAANQDVEISINEKDRLKTKRVNLLQADNTVYLVIEGEGCVFAQAVLSYNVYRLPQSQAFTLAVDVTPVSTADKCSVANLNPCISYSGPDSSSNMAVLEVNLPSGYEPDRTSLYRLVDESKKVKRFEELRNHVIFYFTEVTAEQICAPFIINENSVVEERKNSSVKIYDYYRPEFEVSEYYKMNGCNKSSFYLPQPSIPLQNTLNSTKVTEDYLEQNIIKRDMTIIANETRKTGLNPEFVNTEVEMQLPDGVEGNSEVSMRPETKNIQDKPEQT